MKKYLISLLFLIVGSDIHAATKTIRILTLNTALFKVARVIQIGLKDNKSRAQSIARVIKNMPPDKQPDIICFQEGFDSSNLRNNLYNNIKSIYPYVSFDTRAPAFLGGVDSGLAILSKYPIVAKDIEDFTCIRGDEILARKGVMGTKIEIAKGCPIFVFNTHLQAGIHERLALKPFLALRDRSCEGRKPDTLSSDEVRMMNLRQAQKFIEKFVKKNIRGPVYPPIYLVGDFNIHYQKEPEWYKKIFEVFIYGHDTFDLNSKIHTSIWDDSGKKTDIYKDKHRVDYIIQYLNISHPRIVEAKSIIIPDFTLNETDHLGVLGTITIECP